MTDFLFHKVSEEEKKKIQKQAKDIMEGFSKKLEKLEIDHEHMKDLKFKQSVAKEIELVLDNLKIYQQAITENLVEKDKVHKEFEKTLSHYKQLAAKKNTKY